MRAPTFAIIGAAGFVAPRHLEAIHRVGGRVVGACDVSDAVGVLDRYGPSDAAFFTEIERFDRWLVRQNATHEPVDYVVVCTPNYLHDCHARMAMLAGSDVIVEKPVCLTERNIDSLEEISERANKRVHCVLQLRRHPELAVQAGSVDRRCDIEVDYAVPRGWWYDYSWKGDPKKSGGALTNIGVHLVDVLLWAQGPARRHAIRVEPRRAGGTIWHENDAASYLRLQVGASLPAVRSFKFGTTCIDPSDRDDLHVLEYEAILAGAGWSLEDARPAIRLCEQVREGRTASACR